jgi:hypothetical protein
MVPPPVRVARDVVRGEPPSGSVVGRHHEVRNPAGERSSATCTSTTRAVTEDRSGPGRAPALEDDRARRRPHRCRGRRRCQHGRRPRVVVLVVDNVRALGQPAGARAHGGRTPGLTAGRTSTPTGRRSEAVARNVTVSSPAWTGGCGVGAQVARGLTTTVGNCAGGLVLRRAVNPYPAGVGLLERGDFAAPAGAVTRRAVRAVRRRERTASRSSPGALRLLEQRMNWASLARRRTARGRSRPVVARRPTRGTGRRGFERQRGALVADLPTSSAAGADVAGSVEERRSRRPRRMPGRRSKYSLASPSSSNVHGLDALPADPPRGRLLERGSDITGLPLRNWVRVDPSQSPSTEK